MKKVFRVEIFVKPRRGNMSKKRFNEMVSNVVTGMKRQYREEFKQVSSPQISEYPENTVIIRSPEL